MNKKVKLIISDAVAACMFLIPLAGCTPAEETVDEGNVVVFDYNDSSSRPYSVLAGDDNSVDTPADPQRTGYSFAGWYTAADGGEKVEFPYSVSTSITTLYAHWTTQQYTVSFDYNYESSPLPIQMPVDYGQQVDAPEDPVRDDGNTDAGVFYRWETLPENGVEVSFPYTVSENVTFYAHWVKGIVNFTFDMNYGEEPDKEEQPESVNVKAVEDERFELPSRFQNANMSRTYFEFRGWTTDKNSTRVLTNTQIRNLARNVSDHDITLYAVWQRANYDIAFRLNDPARAGTVFYTTSVTGGEQLSAPATAPEREGYTFIGWYASQRSIEEIQFPYTPTSSGSIYARWKKDAVVTNIFDAEFTEFNPNEDFPGYSGTAYGSGAKVQDVDGSKNAHTENYPLIATEENPNPQHGDYYVSFMYKQGATIRFVINSSVAVDGVALYANLATEINRNLIIGPTGENAWRVVVNGTDVNYSPINFSGRPDANRGEGNYANAFQETLLGTVSLKAGENIIELITNNSNAAAMGGTMRAVAPMVDYIRLDTSATLSWSPVYDNLYDWQP